MFKRAYYYIAEHHVPLDLPPGLPPATPLPHRHLSALCGRRPLTSPITIAAGRPQVVSFVLRHAGQSLICCSPKHLSRRGKEKTLICCSPKHLSRRGKERTHKSEFMGLQTTARAADGGRAIGRGVAISNQWRLGDHWPQEDQDNQ